MKIFIFFLFIFAIAFCKQNQKKFEVSGNPNCKFYTDTQSVKVAGDSVTVTGIKMMHLICNDDSGQIRILNIDVTPQLCWIIEVNEISVCSTKDSNQVFKVYDEEFNNYENKSHI